MILSPESPPQLPASPRKKVVSLGLILSPYNQFIDEVIQAARQRRSAYACFANVHMVIEAARNPAFARAVNAATWVTADGMPLTWATRLLYGIQPERITGMDALPTLLQKLDNQPIPVYFYGATPAVLAECARFCARQYPGLTIAGMHSPPFRPLTPDEETEDIARISASGAGLVFVALGCPKQEAWMAKLSPRIPAVLLGIGGALPVLVGAVRRAPGWMQRFGLEWFYRFVQEPRRLFARYVTTNTLFLYHLFQQWRRNEL